jgi:hypothetical protein
MLLVVGLLSVVQDLVSRGIFVAPSSPNEDHAVEIGQDPGLSSSGEFTPVGGSRR